MEKLCIIVDKRIKLKLKVYLSHGLKKFEKKDNYDFGNYFTFFTNLRVHVGDLLLPCRIVSFF